MAASVLTMGEEEQYLAKFSVKQLVQIKKEFEQDVSGIQASLQTLYNCKAKYASSKEALESFQPKWNDSNILVPLASSMYRPGPIKDMDNIVIDVGTGYYVEKNLECSKDYFKRRIDYLQEQIEKIEAIQYRKSGFLKTVTAIIGQLKSQLL